MSFKFLTDVTYEPALGEIVAFRLENGLEVVMLKRATIPVAAVNIWYKVGSKNEQPGKSGFAHLFEHMMFEGSKNVGKAEHMKLINDVGGIVNGSTNQDRTNFWQVVPSNQLELVLWLEADRMFALDLSQENFENQRATVKEERRQRIDNQPYMHVLYELKDNLAYDEFPYQHSVIGSMIDLENARFEDVQEFHEFFYKPNNAVLAIVGDIRVDNTVKLVEKYFSKIKRGNSVPKIELAEIHRVAERSEIYVDQFAPFPAMVRGYLICERTHPDFYVIELIEKILLDGESSRFYRSLVEKQEVALHVFGGNDGKIGPALFYLFAQLHPAQQFERLRSAVNLEFEKLLQSGVSSEELQKAKNKIKSEWISRNELVSNLADNLCMYTTVFKDPSFYTKEITFFEQISLADLHRVAKKYFTSQNSITIEVQSKEKYPGR